MMRIGKLLISSLIIISCSVNSQSKGIQETNKFVTDFMGKMFIIVKPVSTNGNTISYKAIVADTTCNIDIVVTPLTTKNTRTQVKKVECGKFIDNGENIYAPEI